MTVRKVSLYIRTTHQSSFSNCVFVFLLITKRLYRIILNNKTGNLFQCMYAVVAAAAAAAAAADVVCSFIYCSFFTSFPPQLPLPALETLIVHWPHFQ